MLRCLSAQERCILKYLLLIFSHHQLFFKYLSSYLRNLKKQFQDQVIDLLRNLDFIDKSLIVSQCS